MADEVQAEVVEKNGDKKEKQAVRSFRKEAAKKGKGVKSGAAPQWSFPKNTLEEAIKIAQVIEEKYAGNPVRPEDIVKAVGFNKTNDWRFGDLLRSAVLYGLISRNGSAITLESVGTDIVAPRTPDQRRAALVKAFRSVEPFAGVLDYYKDKKIPEDEFFVNTLTREFNVSRDRVDKFIEVFLKNLNYLKAFNVETVTNARGELEKPPERALPPNRSTTEGTPEIKEPEGREFLDTCFIIMPFGEWYDRYFKEIYVPATREAGFEPVRADSLFSTGTVIEQIWEQISKAKVLLAEVTGKNANVFYELGLAHAIPKPVVFVSGNLDDVPFDLRHLRVVTYDVREPNWAAALQKSIVTYLKNAKVEPEKSIPQPFRDKLHAEVVVADTE
jgi:hypothetical protein